MGGSLSLVRDVDPSAFDCVKLLWLRRFECVYSRASLNVLREVCAYLGSSIDVVAVTPERVLGFDTVHQKAKLVCSFAKPIMVHPASVYVAIDRHKVFVCGCSARQLSGISTSYVYLIDDGVVIEKSDMSITRSGCGVYYSAPFVYVFGGMNSSDIHTGPFNSCEKFHLAEDRWENIAEMHEKRYHFNPAGIEGKVYICGGKCSTIECYYIQEDIFHVLTMPSLPQSSCFSNSTAIVFKSSLVIFTAGEMLHWDVHSGACSSLKLKESFNPWSNTIPLVIGSTVFLVSAMDRVCRGVDLDTGEVIGEIHFTSAHR